MRDRLCALAFANNPQQLDTVGIERLQLASADAFIEIRIEPNGPSFHPGAAATLDAALGALLAGRGQPDAAAPALHQRSQCRLQARNALGERLL